MKVIKSIERKLRRVSKNQFFRFILVGSICTLQNLVLLYFLTSILKWHYLLSTSFLGVTVNSFGYYLNKRFTFKSNKFGVRLLLYEFFKYHTVMLSSYLTILLLMYLLVDIFHIWYLLANLILTIVMTTYNFLFHRKWTFK
jgi:putative flippase GtrA